MSKEEASEQIRPRTAAADRVKRTIRRFRSMEGPPLLRCALAIALVKKQSVLKDSGRVH